MEQGEQGEQGGSLEEERREKMSVPVLLVTLVVLVCVVNVYLHQYLPNNNNKHSEEHLEEHLEEEEERCLALVRDLPDFSRGKMVHIGSSMRNQEDDDEHQEASSSSSSSSSCSSEAKCMKRVRNRKEHTPPSFYYFLHVPRCAGRTLNFCLLKSVFPPKDRCLTSYKENSQLDKGALDKLGHACRVQGTHDDLSVLTQLPHKNTVAVFTQIRNPVDRVLSAYEFSLQVATRYHFATKRKKNTNRTATDEVWPWLDLVPIMMESLARREEARKSLSSSLSKPNIWVRQHNASNKSFVYYNRVMNETREDLEGLDDGHLVLGDLDPYDNSLVMSLADFVKLPEVHDLLHNNQLYQLLGITNISKEPGLAKGIRRCCAGAAAKGTYEGTAATSLHRALLKRAERLVDDLWHVSVFDDLEGSHSSLCAASGWDLDQLSYKNGEKIVRTMRDEVDEMEGKEGSRLDQEKLLSVEYGRQNVSVREAFEKCVRQNREKKDVKNKVKFLRQLQDPYGRQILFSRENRAKISKDVLEYIRHHNQLDFELYEMAKSRYNLEEQQCKLNRDDATIDAKEKYI